MGNLTTATIFVVTLNVLMFLVTVAMINMNPDGSVCYNVEGSVIGETMQQQGNLSVSQTNALNDLPGSAGTVTIGDAIGFTDIFNNILGWMKTAPGIKYVYGVVSAPYNILKCMNLPAEFVVAVGTLWYLISLLVLVAFLWGRD
jgi:hypothetical protein